MWRKLRAAFGIATTWAMAWGVWGGAMTAILALLGSPYPIPVWQIVAMSAARSAVFGFLGGGLFAAVLTVRHGRRTLAELSAGRLGVWGALAGLVVPFSLTVALLASMGFALSPGFLARTVIVYALPGLATAAGTIKVAQWSQERLEGGASTGRVGPGDPDERAEHARAGS